MEKSVISRWVATGFFVWLFSNHLGAAELTRCNGFNDAQTAWAVVAAGAKNPIPLHPLVKANIKAETVLWEGRAPTCNSPIAQRPVIEGEYTHIYAPQGDIFLGPDTQDLKNGTHYESWQPNDHCFMKGADGRWHTFGITHPESQPGQRRHQGEFVLFHAVSPTSSFESSLLPQSWTDKPKVLTPGQRPGENPNCHAPTIVHHEGVYKMIYGPCPFRLAISKDLGTWTPKGPVGINEKSGRDPSLFFWKGSYYLVYCAGNLVKASTSKDFTNWSEPIEIYRGEVETYQCESPTIIHNKESFYLFWCLWDTANKNGNGYDERSFVVCSNDPLNFRGHPVMTELKAHAPEIFQDEQQNWFISSVQYPVRGISVSRLTWK